MIKKRYLIILTVAVVSVLLGSLLYNNVTLAQKGKEPTIHKDSVEITLLDIQTDNVGFGVRVGDSRVATLPFAFTPKASFLNVTNLWITVVAWSTTYENVRFNITVNGLTLRSSITEYHSSYPTITSTYIDASDLLPETITPGTNVVVISNPELWDTGTGQWVSYWIHLFKVDVFIEYKY